MGDEEEKDRARKRRRRNRLHRQAMSFRGYKEKVMPSKGDYKRTRISKRDIHDEEG